MPATVPPTPVAPRPRRDPRKAFLDALRRLGNVSLAARRAGRARWTFYRWRAEDEGFAREWDAALDEAVDTLEAEAWRRAREGVEEPVFYQGAQVGMVRRYSDTLLIFLLRGHRPERFRERATVDLRIQDLDAAIERELAHLAHPHACGAPANRSGTLTGTAALPG